MENATILAAGAGAAGMLLLVVVVLWITRRRRSRADLEAMLVSAQHEADDLRHRLDELTGGPRGGPAHLEELFTPATTRPREAEFVITHVGEAGLDQAKPPEDAVHVPDRLVLSATLGEPLVKIAAFSHGVR